MKHQDFLFTAIDLIGRSAKEVREFADRSGISVSRLRELNRVGLMPTKPELSQICDAVGLSHLELALAMGKLDLRIVSAIRKNAKEIGRVLESAYEEHESPSPGFESKFRTDLGELYQGDCVALMSSLESEQFDVIFADPPFNLKKMYPSGIDDDLKQAQYLEWTEQWLDECVRLLKPGGSTFIWNLPKWNIHIAQYLSDRLTFRHWIDVDIKYSLPIAGRLYPSHYSLLYFCKGSKPRTFQPDRLPMEICPKCKADLRDYGGYKHKMNPKGINLSDTWTDISPVRHAKYKKRKEANELPVKLVDRVIEMSSNPGDTVFDPFGGAGTTYIVAELKNRKWVGVEVGPVDVIIDRFASIEDEREYLETIRSQYNALFDEESKIFREAKGLWTCESVQEKVARKSLGKGTTIPMQFSEDSIPRRSS